MELEALQPRCAPGAPVDGKVHAAHAGGAGLGVERDTLGILETRDMVALFLSYVPHLRLHEWSAEDVSGIGQLHQK